MIADDEGKPDVAVGKVKAFIDRDKVDFVVGPVFSNVLGAIVKPSDRSQRDPHQSKRRIVGVRRQGVQSRISS